MAAKNLSKRDKETLYIISDAHTKLYSLSTLGEQAERLPLDVSTFYDSVAGLCDAARESFTNAVQRIPSSHPSHALLKNAGAALESLERFMWIAYHGPDQDEVKASVTTKRVIGKVIRAFTGEAGRWMERAELAIDPKDCPVGYLQEGLLIDGGEGMSLPRKNNKASEFADNIAVAARAFAREVSNV